MNLDTNAYPALWALTQACGIRPEYVLPVLWIESGFNPAITNSIGCVGLNQACSGVLSGLGVTAATYATWSASDQLTKSFNPYMEEYASKGIHSAVRVFQANLLPATLATATNLGDAIMTKGDAYYSANAWLDSNHDGRITLQDLANALEKAVAVSAVQTAISGAYAQAPAGYSNPNDPVYGTDFMSASNKAWIAASSVVAVSALVTWLSATNRLRLPI